MKLVPLLSLSALALAVVAAACGDSTPAPASPYASSVAVAVSASASSSPPTAVTAVASAQAAARADAGIVDGGSSDAAILDAGVSDAAPLQPPKPGPTNMQTCDRAIDIAKACPEGKRPISKKDVEKMIKDAAGSDETRKKLEMRCKDMLEQVSKQCLGEDVKLVR